MKKNVTVTTGGIHATIPATLDAFICPHCDKTHFQITMPDDSAVFVSFTPQEAEKLAADLINPPMPPRELYKLKSN